MSTQAHTPAQPTKLECLSVGDAVKRSHRVRLYHGTASYTIDESERLLIVRAMNSHADILAALKELHWFVNQGPSQGEVVHLDQILNRASTAIAKAEGQS